MRRGARVSIVDRRLASGRRAQRTAAVVLLAIALALGCALGCANVLGLATLQYDEVDGPSPSPSDGGLYAEDGAPLSPPLPSSDASDTPGELDADAPPSGSSPICGGAIDCERVVFVTSALFSGNLAGLGGGDTLCTSIAAQTSHPRISGRRFRAWLSIGTSSPATRLAHGTRRYILPNGVAVALRFEDFLGAGIRVPISLDEHGVAVASPYVWTNTKTGAVIGGVDCGAWTDPSSDAFGLVGYADTHSAGWTNAGRQACNEHARLYCFEE